MKDNNTDIFADLAGGKERMRKILDRVRAYWNGGVNKVVNILIIIFLVSGVIFYMSSIRAPYNFPTNTLVNVERGQSLANITESLERQGVIRNGLAMRAIARIYGVEKSMRSGDYIFKSEINVLEVIKRLSTGTFGLEPVRVRIREGSTVRDVAKVLEDRLLKFDKEKFLEMVSDSEGYLFPDTYYFLPNTSESQVVGAMKDNFHKHFAEIAETAKKTGYSMHEIVILASIVELEASIYEDRRKIAGVLLNRLEIDMPLQVDVSFIYIMGKTTFDLTLADLKYDSPYNTYIHKGLPPKPLVSPSMAALRATVYSYDSDWIFFLADSYGKTHFTRTYAEHLVKKSRYIDNQ